MLTPTVISVDQASERPTSSADTIEGAISLSQALGFFLSRDDQPFGAIMSRQDLHDMLSALEEPPKHFVGIASPSSGWDMGYWWDAIEPSKVERLVALEGGQPAKPSSDWAAKQSAGLKNGF
ncbi:hypothetical protein ATU3C_25160 [Agrobacterium genomosp. 3 str. RTP8]|uniref:hypothetical protein n=1 Tax=Agrobacterium tomkonis TaxID=1183410 RepID=UPI001CD97A89|nr:hypothetical protein [Agrobacterium tomkonis RTP8]